MISILSLKTWSSLRALGLTLRLVGLGSTSRRRGRKLGQVRGNWLCFECMPRNDGISWIRRRRTGMMEYWVLWNGIYFYKEGTNYNIKSYHHPLSIPNIPFFHHSIISIGLPVRINRFCSQIFIYHTGGLAAGGQAVYPRQGGNRLRQVIAPENHPVRVNFSFDPPLSESSLPGF